MPKQIVKSVLKQKRNRQVSITNLMVPLQGGEPIGRPDPHTLTGEAAIWAAFGCFRC